MVIPVVDPGSDRYDGKSPNNGVGHVIDIILRIFLAVCKLATFFAVVYPVEMRDILLKEVFNLCDCSSPDLLDSIKKMYEQLDAAKMEYKMSEASKSHAYSPIKDNANHAAKISEAFQNIHKELEAKGLPFSKEREGQVELLWQQNRRDLHSRIGRDKESEWKTWAKSV